MINTSGIALRQAAHLTDRCTITRGTYPDLTTTTNVPCTVRPSTNRGTREVEAVAGEQITVPLGGVRIPASTDVARGDVVTVTRSADGLFDGRWFTVESVNPDSWVATRTVVASEDQK